MASLYIERPQGGRSNYHEDDQKNLSDDEDDQQNLSDDEDYPKNLEDVERKELFQSAMTSEWGDVLEKYKKEPRIQKFKITSTEDTLLHIAVTDDLKEVTELVDVVTKVEILEMKNDMGNTPLHLAAAMGKVGMCKCMVKKYRQLFSNRQYDEQPNAVKRKKATDLIESRNKEGETPLFVAALHGKKEAFLYLYSQCPRGKGRKYWRRSSDGNSILHVAISGEFFDLAFDMLKKCDNKRHDLINSVNERGLTPLHFLASNPSAFQSGNHLRRLEEIIYECIVVEPLKETDVKSALAEAIRREEDESREKPSEVLPENYRIFLDLFEVLRRVFNIEVFQWPRLCPQKQEKNQRDAEDPSPQISASTENRPPQISASTDILIQRSHGDGGKSHENSRERSYRTQEQPFPSNYKTCYDFFELAMTALQVIGFGYIRMPKIKERKQKHTWAVQIMDELVKKASSWEYDAGSKPQEPNLILQAFRDGPPEEEKNVARSPNSSHKPNEPKEEEGKMTDFLNEILNIPPKSEKGKRQDDKNTIQMTMENKQPHMYSLIMEMKKENEDDGGKKESPLLIAAKMGVKEMVRRILKDFPVAIRDTDRDGKNLVLLAVEYRQPHVYQLLLKRKFASRDSVFQKVDKEGNSALHLAATLGQNKPWRIPGAALQMQWEIKWYQYVKQSMPRHFFTRRNDKGRTAKEVFTETHEDLVKDGGTWLTNTSQSCSVVAALIATVAFAAATTVPGGVRQDTGIPTLEGKPAFEVFAVTSLIALCCSVTSLTMFLAILTSRYQEADFRHSLPVKLIFGLSTLFISIASILVSFCAGHFFVLENKIKFAAFPVYGVTCLPITFFAVAQLPLYADLIRSYVAKVPQRTSEMTSL